VPDRLFTARFFLMCAFSFTVFMSAFQLLPTAPFHILALGGTGVEAGLFLGFLTYASAVSAPITGAVADRLGFVGSGVLFGLGFGSAYPIFVAHLMHHVAEHRRGATFGALIGAFDTGIGTGSIAVGWLSEHYGFPAAYGVAGALAVLSIPYYLWMERRHWTQSVSSRPAA
jgi:MFS family permease